MLRQIIPATLIVLLAVLLPTSVQAWTPSDPTNPQIINAESDTDRFYNYDFQDDHYDRTKVDWPVDLIFWGCASVQKVYDLYWGEANWDSTMHEKLDDGSGLAWDGDKGTKGKEDWQEYRTHTRPYAANGIRMYSQTLSFYVVATAHRDCLPNWSGYSHYAEEELVTIAENKNCPVERNCFNCYNEEDYRVEGTIPQHIWYNPGGKVSKVHL